MLKTESQKSKLLTTEGRMALYNSLGRNMSVYKVQLDYLSEVIDENPKDQEKELEEPESEITDDSGDSVYEKKYYKIIPYITFVLLVTLHTECLWIQTSFKSVLVTTFEGIANPIPLIIGKLLFIFMFLSFFIYHKN